MSDYDPTPQQEQAIREYLQESIVPLIEQVLVKKLGQAMSYAAQELVNPKREWVGLTDEEMFMNCPNWLTQEHCKTWLQQIEAKLKEKNS